MKNSSKLWMILPLVLVVLVVGCSNTENPTAAIPEIGQVDSLRVGTEQSYPGYCFCLNVPFLCQYDPPGDMWNTKNCGQTCGVMLGGYYNGGTVAPWVITSTNSYLANRFNDSRYRVPNGWYTNFTGRNEVGNMLWDFHRLRYSLYHGSTPEDVVWEAARGRPVICGVRISGGRLVGSGGTPHWVLVIGWNGRIILNDPGTKSGNRISYTKEQFDDSWEEDGRIYAPVFR